METAIKYRTLKGINRTVILRGMDIAELNEKVKEQLRKIKEKGYTVIAIKSGPVKKKKGRKLSKAKQKLLNEVNKGRLD